METVEVHVTTKLSSTVGMQQIWRSKAQKNRISRESMETKKKANKVESQSMSLALYHQVVPNDAALSAVGSCQASGLSACSALSALGHDM